MEDIFLDLKKELSTKGIDNRTPMGTMGGKPLEKWGKFLGEILKKTPPLKNPTLLDSPQKTLGGQGPKA